MNPLFQQLTAIVFPIFALVAVGFFYPPAVLNFMLAEKFDESPEAGASIVLLGNLSSVATIPALLVWGL